MSSSIKHLIGGIPGLTDEALSELKRIVDIDSPDFSITDLEEVAKRADLPSSLSDLFTDANLARFRLAANFDESIQSLKNSATASDIVELGMREQVQDFVDFAKLSDEVAADLNQAVDEVLRDRDMGIKFLIDSGRASTPEEALELYSRSMQRTGDAADGPINPPFGRNPENSRMPGADDSTSPPPSSTVDEMSTTAAFVNPSTVRRLWDGVAGGFGWIGGRASNAWSAAGNGITAPARFVRSALKNPYANNNQTAFSKAARGGDEADGSILPTSVIPADFKPIEKHAMYWKYVDRRQWQVFRKTLPADAGLEQFGIGHRFIEPVVKHLDAQISGSGVRDAFIGLKTQADEITRRLGRGELSVEEAQAELRVVFGEFADDPANQAKLNDLSEHIRALKMEIEARDHVIGGPEKTDLERSKYSEIIGLSWEQKQDLLTYVDDLEKMVTQFSNKSNNNEYLTVITDELDRLSAGNQTNRNIANSIMKTINHRLNILGDDVYMRQNGHLVDRDHGDIRNGAQAAYEDIFRLQNDLSSTVYNPYDRVGPANSTGALGRSKATDGNAERYTYDMMTFYKDPALIRENGTIDWGKANATKRYLGLVTTLFEQRRDDAIAGAFKVLSLRRGVSDIEVFPSDILVDLKSFRDQAYRDGNFRDGLRWEKILNVAQRKLDDSVADGPRAVNAENAAGLAQMNLMRTVQSGQGRFGLNISQPVLNDIMTGISNYGWRRPLAWVTGNRTTPGVPEANTQQSLGVDKFVRTPFFGNGIQKPESVDQAAWNSRGRIRRTLSYLSDEQYANRPMLVNAVLNVTTDPIRWSWNLSRHMALAPFRSRQALGTVGLWSAAAGTLYGTGNYLATDDGALESAYKGVTLPVTAMYYLSKPAVWAGDLISDNVLGAGSRLITGGDTNSISRAVGLGDIGEGGIPLYEAHRYLYESFMNPRGIFDLAEGTPEEEEAEAEEEITVTTLEDVIRKSAETRGVLQDVLNAGSAGVASYSGYGSALMAANPNNPNNIQSRYNFLNVTLSAQASTATDPAVQQKAQQLLTQLQASYNSFMDPSSGKFATDLTLIEQSMRTHTLQKIIEIDNQLNNVDASGAPLTSAPPTDAEAVLLYEQQQTLITEMQEANQRVIDARLNQIEDIMINQFGTAVGTQTPFQTAPTPGAVNIPLPGNIIVASNTSVQPGNDTIRTLGLASLTSVADVPVVEVSASSVNAQTLYEAIGISSRGIEQSGDTISSGIANAQLNINPLNTLMTQLDQKIAESGDAEKYSALKAQMEQYVSEQTAAIELNRNAFGERANELVDFMKQQRLGIREGTELSEANNILNLQLQAQEALNAVHADYLSVLQENKTARGPAFLAFVEAIETGQPLSNVPGVENVNFTPAAMPALDTVTTTSSPSVVPAQPTPAPGSQDDTDPSAAPAAPAVPTEVATAATATPAAATPAAATPAAATPAAAPAKPQWQIDLEATKAEANKNIESIRTNAGYISNLVSDDPTNQTSLPGFIRQGEVIIQNGEDLIGDLRRRNKPTGIASLEAMIDRVESNNSSIETLLIGLQSDNAHVQGHLSQAEALATELNGLSGPNAQARAEQITQELKDLRTGVKEHAEEAQNNYGLPTLRLAQNSVGVSSGNDTEQGNGYYKTAYGLRGQINENLKTIGGGEDGLPYQLLGNDNPHGTSVIGGYLGLAKNSALQLREDWIQTMKNNSQTQAQRNTMNALNSGFLLIGGLAGLSIFKTALGWAGVEIPKPISLLATLAVVGFVIHRSGIVGKELNDYQSSRNPYSRSNSGLTQGNTGTTRTSAGVTVPSSAGSNGSNVPDAARNGGNNVIPFPVRRADGSADNEIFYHADGRITQRHNGGNLEFSRGAEQRVRDAVETTIVNKLAGQGQNLPANIDGKVDVVMLRPGHKDGDAPLQEVRVNFSEDRADALEMLKTANAN